MDRLSNEIICMIVEQSTGRLAPLATISRRWQEPVERRLFRTINLRVKESRDLERSTKWCSKRKFPEPELNDEDEGYWEDEGEDHWADEDSKESDTQQPPLESKPREMEEITISCIDSFKYVFEDRNSYRQKYLRLLHFQVIVPFDRDDVMEVKEEEQNQHAFRSIVQDFFLTLEGWKHCKELELRLLTKAEERPSDWEHYHADPVDWEPRLSLCSHEREKLHKISFITSFSYSDYGPIEVQPSTVCDLARMFPNLRELVLSFKDAEDYEDHEHCQYLYSNTADGLKSLCGHLPRLRELEVIRSSYCKPLKFAYGTDALGAAVRKLAQPTVETLEIRGFSLSRDFFCNDDSEGNDEGGWKALRHLKIGCDIASADGKYLLQDKENWTSNASSLHPQGDATTLDPLVDAFYTDVLRMPLIEDVDLSLRRYSCKARFLLRAERDSEDRNRLAWFLKWPGGKEFRAEEILR